MSIVFLILKTLGILLLIPVIMLLILLICPIAYRLEGDFDGKSPHFKVKVSWALIFLRMKAAYEEDIDLTVKVFGFPVYRTDAKKWSLLGGKEVKESVVEERSASKSKNSKTEMKDPVQNHIEKPDNFKIGPVQEKKEESQDVLDFSWDESEEISAEHMAFKEKKEKKREFPGKRIVGFLKKCYNKCREIIGKLREISKKAKDFKELLEDDELRAALSRLRKYGMDGLKYLFPQRLEGNLVFGLEDPALTGKVLGCLAMTMPIYGSHLDITPDFQRSVLKGHILAAGRIRRYQLLKLAWNVYRDKDLLKQKDRVAEMIGG